MVFKAVGEHRPYPEHGVHDVSAWSRVAPQLIRLDELVTTKRQLDLQTLLADDSTFYGDLFAHVVRWQGTLYLEDGLHRALRAALAQRPVLHARVLDLDVGGAGHDDLDHHGRQRRGGEPVEHGRPDADLATVGSGARRLLDRVRR